MAEYKGIVVYRAYQDVCVEADSEDEARQSMQEQFDLHRAIAEMEVYDLEEIK
jgi:hypothetical protein